jgi:hypothetical protein
MLRLMRGVIDGIDLPKTIDHSNEWYEQFPQLQRQLAFPGTPVKNSA